MSSWKNQKAALEEPKTALSRVLDGFFRPRMSFDNRRLGTAALGTAELRMK